VNQEGGVPAFPEATAGTDAAVDYVNRELGGMAAIPAAEDVRVQAEEDARSAAPDGQRHERSGCAHRCAHCGNDSLYKSCPEAAGGRGQPGGEPDFLTAGIDALLPGSPGRPGLAVFIAKVLSTRPVRRSPSHGDNEGAKAAVNVLFNPALNKLGITDIKPFLSPNRHRT
jgi:hypothetical protein